MVAMPSLPALSRVALRDLVVEDETSFRHVGLYADLSALVERLEVRFRVLPPGRGTGWDRALFLNLTFWGAADGGDVLCSASIPADVLAHVAWHAAAAEALFEKGERPSAEALFLSEAVASAFDVYLVGRLLGHAPTSSFLESQVPAMADAADASGATPEDFDALLEHIVEDPDRAFEDLRALLFDASRALYRCKTVDEALAALQRFDDHRYACLLHRHELSNWVLYARAYATNAEDAHALRIDAALRNAPVSLDWLDTHWVRPTLAGRKPIPPT